MHNDAPFIVCGIERSGSTFVYQVLKELGTSVTKTHSYELGSPLTPKLYTFRDPRDVICSYARTWVKANIEQGATIEGPPDEDLRVATHKLFYSPNARQLDYRCYRWEAEQGAPIAFIKYENYFGGNERALVDQLVYFMTSMGHPQPTSEKIDMILGACSIDKNKERAARMNSFFEWDDETQVHGNHISNNGESSWREEFNFDIACHVDKYLGDFIIELGYEKDREWKMQFFKGGS